jgi:hypothetical protein
MRRGWLVLAMGGIACGQLAREGDDSQSPPLRDGGVIDGALEGGRRDSAVESGRRDGADLADRDTLLADTARDMEVEKDACGAHEVATPKFSPAPGVRDGCDPGVIVTLSTATPGASIFFTTDGSDPGPTSQRYNDPVAVPETTTLRAYAIAPCMKDSAVATGTYTLNLAPYEAEAPIPNPPGGTYRAGFDLSLVSASADAVICYTLDGSLPLCSSGSNESCGPDPMPYGSATIPIDSTVTSTAGTVVVNAVSCFVAPPPDGPCPGWLPPVTYTLQVDPVSFAPAATTTVPVGGALSGVQIAESGPTTDQPYAFICWSTDGVTTPDCTCAGATPENASAEVGPGLYVTTGNATPVMQLQEAPGASGITVRAVGCATGYAPSDAPFATITWSN